MKRAIKRIVEKSNRKLQQIVQGMEINLLAAVAELLMAAQWHIEQLAGAAGMKIIHHRLPNYERLQQETRLDQAMIDRIALGLSTPVLLITSTRSNPV